MGKIKQGRGMRVGGGRGEAGQGSGKSVKKINLEKNTS